MKRLRVNWAPDTMMVVSLTIANPPESFVESNQFQFASCGEIYNGMPCTKFIIISDGGEMHVRVMNQTTLERA